MKGELLEKVVANEVAEEEEKGKITHDEDFFKKFDGNQQVCFR